MIGNGLPLVDVREIETLRHYFTDQQASKVKSLHVYGPADRLSAIYITVDDEVYLAGGDSLVGDDLTAPTLKECRLILELSGKSIAKVVVGVHFGAALTEGHDLYIWGSNVGREAVDVPAGLTRLALGVHQSGTGSCSECFCELVPRRWGGVLLSWCPQCRTYCNRVSKFPLPSSWVGEPRTVFGYKADDVPPKLPESFCVRCGFKECFVQRVANFMIVFCWICEHPIDGNTPIIPLQTSSNPHKVTFPSPLHIEDIAAGRNFMLLQTSSDLIVWGEIGDQKYNHAMLNLDNVVPAKIACGSDHVAVITDEGALYTSGEGGAGQLGYEWSTDWPDHLTLWKVELAEQAVDVACGCCSTVCLLKTGKYVLFGADYAKVLNVREVCLYTSNSLFCVPSNAPRNYSESIESVREQFAKVKDDRSVVLTGVVTDIFILLQTSKSEKHEGHVLSETNKSVRDASSQTDFESKISQISIKLKDIGCQTVSKSEEVLEDSAVLQQHLGLRRCRNFSDNFS
ncbi:hypothetical protein GE061_000027 [Apolygus lucorum]|uniref:Uncharacterized protein n=1 Tax=Apolygus lucorum TaxID=248454 RepID=A0A8S9Y5S2_APOLU|nr:hypothetical protein GE061_000027 [Apolygus lucorum]